MQKLTISLIGIVSLILSSQPAFAARYSEELCADARFTCITVQKGQTWESLFPDPEVQELVMRINRMNVKVVSGMVIAVPKDLATADIMEYAPFTKTIPATGQKTILVDPVKKAWGAYDEDGTLIQWGPASLGKEWCEDIGSRCHTVSGEFTIYRKHGENCASSKFPIPDGGAPMPYCMFFHGGYALHSSPQVPGFNASHGCVRIFYNDAKWLNEEFVDVGKNGTRVIVEPY